jgi:DNA polymerase-1
MDTYFLRYPNVQQYMEDTREKARNDGYVETLFGRRLYLPDITASNMQRRQGAERAAINAPMQGSAADIIKRAMITVDEWLQQTRPSACLVMQVHDELVLEVAEEELETVRDEVTSRMMTAAALTVPLVVDSGHGKDWDTAH